MIKKLILSLFLFTTFLLPTHVFATTVGISLDFGQNITAEFNGAKVNGWAGRMNADFNSPDFNSAAYCVDILHNFDRGYDVQYIVESPFTNVFDYDDKSNFYVSGSGKSAAWLMNEYIGVTDAAQAAGLQLAIWDALYGEYFTVLNSDLTTAAAYGFYKTYSFALGKADLDLFNAENFKVAVLEEGQDVLINTPVPEPATMLLFSIGLLGLAGIGRKKTI